MGQSKMNFSLIEVSVSLCVLVLILAGLFRVLYQGFNSVDKSKTKTIVYGLIREKLEEKCAQYCWPPFSEPRQSVSGFTGLERQVITTRPYLSYNDLAHIQVTVWWNNGTQSESLETLCADY
ncbi:MAG: hypothetical protein ABH872_02670 [Candidatus Omnitrophota bacterium]